MDKAEHLEQFASLYIGCKVIRAVECDKYTFQQEVQNKALPDGDNEPGYMVIYPDKYISWSPADTFIHAYRLVSEYETELFRKGLEINDKEVTA